MSFILYFIVIAAAMLGMSRYLPGFHVDSFKEAIIAAVVLGVVNVLVKPILFVLTLPFTILTLGLFLLILNAIMLWITDALVRGLHIDGFLTTFIAALILSLVGMIWKAATKKEK